jgi:hypothetical protein
MIPLLAHLKTADGLTLRICATSSAVKSSSNYFVSSVNFVISPFTLNLVSCMSGGFAPRTPQAVYFPPGQPSERGRHSALYGVGSRHGQDVAPTGLKCLPLIFHSVFPFHTPTKVSQVKEVNMLHIILIFLGDSKR